MLYYCHVYAPDAPLLHRSTARIQSLDQGAEFVIINDPSNPVPFDRLPQGERFTVIRSPYPLGGNLNGVSMIKGMLETMKKLLTERKQEFVVKFDVDAFFNATHFLQESNTTENGEKWHYIGLERSECMTAAGDCYRLHLEAINAVLEAVESYPFAVGVPVPEDRTILQFILRARPQLNILTYPYSMGYHVGLHDTMPSERHVRAWVVHTGETNAQGAKASRDFVRLRMEALAFICETLPAILREQRGKVERELVELHGFTNTSEN